MNDGQLTEHHVGKTALAIIDAAGRSALSIEAVASEMARSAEEVAAIAPTRARLIDLACDQIYGEVDLRPMEVPWPDRLRTYSRSFRQALLRHPRCALIITSRPIATLSSMAVAERALSELIEVGFTPEEANQVLLVIVSFVSGHALIEIGTRYDDLDGHDPAEVESFRTSLPREKLPVAAQAVSHVDRDAEFEVGLKLIVDGLERNLLHGAP